MIIRTMLQRSLLAAALIAQLGHAQGDLPMAAPEEVGFDSAQLAKIAPFFQQRVDNGEIAGVVTLVARHGKIVNFEAIGYQDVARDIPMQKDTIFRVYSMTKPIVSAALMMLYQDGKFQLTDPLSKYIPEFANLTVLREPNSALDDTVALERPPTVQDVLRHTAGLSHGLGNSDYDKAFVGSGIFSTETSLEEMMTLLSELPLMNQPGSQFRYSVGPDVVLRLVEVISGMPADEYLQQKMFDPLGMSDTGYWVDSDNAHRLSPIHWLNSSGDLVPINQEYGSPAGGVLATDWSANSYTFNHEFKGGSFGLLATTEDYWRFSQAMLNGGELNGARILGPRTVEFMHRNHLTEAQNATFSPAMGFGLGFATIEDPDRVGYITSENTYYWGGAAATSFWIDPVEDIVVIAMTQHMGTPGAGSVRGELSALVYGALVD